MLTIHSARALVCQSAKECQKAWQNAKKCLKKLTKCEELYSSEDLLGDFGKAIMNYYQHYTDDHSSTWCRFHKKVTNSNLTIVTWLVSAFTIIW